MNLHPAASHVLDPSARPPLRVSLIAMSPERKYHSSDYLALSVGALLNERRDDATESPATPEKGHDPRAVTTSVLLNTRNHGAFIEQCVESVLAQTLPATEIIVYDDGSEDDTVLRLRRYSSRIRLIEGQPQSLPSYQRQAHAVQTAFEQSAGQLIFLLDGDDRFRPDKIEQYCAAYEAQRDAALIQAPMEKIDEEGRSLGSNFEARKHVDHHLAEIYRQQDVDFYYPTSALAFARTYLDAVLPLDFSDGCPLWTDTRLGIMAPFYGRVVTLPHALTDWRRHAKSDSIRSRVRNLQIQQTLMRTEVFNSFCRRYGLKTISAWRNARFYKQLLRFSLPELVYDCFHHLRSRSSRRVHAG